MISIAASSDSSIAGDTYTLTCSMAAIPDDIAVEPILTWSGPGVDQSSVQLSSSNSTLALTFNPLLTSHRGAYTCEAMFNISQVGISDMTSSITENITVQSEFTVKHLIMDTPKEDKPPT